MSIISLPSSSVNGASIMIDLASPRPAKCDRSTCQMKPKFNLSNSVSNEMHIDFWMNPFFYRLDRWWYTGSCAINRVCRQGARSSVSLLRQVAEPAMSEKYPALPGSLFGKPGVLRVQANTFPAGRRIAGAIAVCLVAAANLPEAARIAPVDTVAASNAAAVSAPDAASCALMGL